MAIKTVAAIDVGSYELEMKIFEVSVKKGITQVNHVRKIIELGKDTYATGRIDFTHINELCDILYGFTEVMKEYQVEDYVAYTTSSIREADNKDIILDRIRVKTGINVQILSNSEQRFLCYKALAVKPEFVEYLNDGTAIVDVGAGSVQISIFDEGSLVTTQNLKLGTIRIRELLYRLSNDREHFNKLIEELINNDIATFKKFFLEGRTIKNIVVVGDYVEFFARKASKQVESMTKTQFIDRFNSLMGKNSIQLSEKLSITEEQATLLTPCVLIYKRFIEESNAENIWFPRVNLCDGIGADYGFSTGRIRPFHDFESDIINEARIIAMRYRANMQHTTILEKNVLTIFDALKKYHGLNKRERMMLQIAAILHDCGKYISMSLPGEASYNIIMSTEIIGLSHKEREIIADVVKYNTEDIFDDYEEIYKNDKENYLTVVKLVAILRVSNAMDRSHKQKFKNPKVVVDENELIITTYSGEDITLERGLFKRKADFFEEVYGIRPVLRQKKMN